MICDWNYGICETCLKNSHEKVKMRREKVFCCDLEGNYYKEMWVCPVCGATKEF